MMVSQIHVYVCHLYIAKVLSCGIWSCTLQSLGSPSGCSAHSERTTIQTSKPPICNTPGTIPKLTYGWSLGWCETLGTTGILIQFQAFEVGVGHEGARNVLNWVNWYWVMLIFSEWWQAFPCRIPKEWEPTMHSFWKEYQEKATSGRRIQYPILISCMCVFQPAYPQPIVFSLQALCKAEVCEEIRMALNSSNDVYDDWNPL